MSLLDCIMNIYLTKVKVSYYLPKKVNKDFIRDDQSSFLIK